MPTNKILNAAALMETRVSNSQANDIGLLTKVTVVSQLSSGTGLRGLTNREDDRQVYLPLGLVTVRSASRKRSYFCLLFAGVQF
jgi:hypothetical protein